MAAYLISLFEILRLREQFYARRRSLFINLSMLARVPIGANCCLHGAGSYQGVETGEVRCRPMESISLLLTLGLAGGSGLRFAQNVKGQ
jgi:hypothetical protein